MESGAAARSGAIRAARAREPLEAARARSAFAKRKRGREMKIDFANPLARSSG